MIKTFNICRSSFSPIVLQRSHIRRSLLAPKSLASFAIVASLATSIYAIIRRRRRRHSSSGVIATLTIAACRCCCSFCRYDVHVAKSVFRVVISTDGQQLHCMSAEPTSVCYYTYSKVQKQNANCRLLIDSPALS